jgi:hypothetical protein
LFIRALPFFIIQVLAPYMDKKKYES